MKPQGLSSTPRPNAGPSTTFDLLLTNVNISFLCRTRSSLAKATAASTGCNTTREHAPGDDRRPTATPAASLFIQNFPWVQRQERTTSTVVASKAPSWRLDTSTLITWLEGRDARNCPATFSGSIVTTMTRGEGKIGHCESVEDRQHMLQIHSYQCKQARVVLQATAPPASCH